MLQIWIVCYNITTCKYTVNKSEAKGINNSLLITKVSTVKD